MRHIRLLLFGVTAIFILYSFPFSVLAVTYCSQAPLTGDYTISGACTINTTVEGAQGGDIIIASGATVTLLADQTLVYNTGKKITITNTAIVNLNNTAGHASKLTQGTICITDADSDLHPLTVDGNNQSYTTTTCPAGTIARTAGQTADCNDNDPATYANVLCYADVDGDHASGGGNNYSTTSHSVCAGTCASVGESANAGTDCCDSDANAYLGQTLYFTSADACGNYNYDCDASNLETLDTTGIQGSTYACVNPCVGCSLNYGATAGWLTAPPATCGGTGTLNSMTGAYVSYTGSECYTVASCANLITSNASAQRGCH